MDKPAKLTKAQAALLQKLAEDGPCRASLMSKTVDALVKAGLATSSTRGLLTSQNLTITALGRAHLAAAPEPTP